MTQEASGFVAPAPAGTPTNFEAGVTAGQVVSVEKPSPLTSVPAAEFTGNREQVIGYPRTAAPGVVLAPETSDAMTVTFEQPSGSAGYVGQAAVEHADVAVDPSSS